MFDNKLKVLKTRHITTKNYRRDKRGSDDIYS
jgi:hypothetical protein